MINISFIIRQFKSADKEIIKKLNIDGLNQFGASIGDPALDKDLDKIEELYIANGDFLVGTVDENLICMGAYRKVDEITAEIKRIRIKMEFQGRGYGSQILAALEKSAEYKGYTRLILDTTSRQIPAQKLFLKNNYIEFSRRKYDEMELIYYCKILKDN
ncbi:GNAT family N-acetyltransferase [Paenibacillus solani]|uniref:GNAT family N-acetyltransferase n=1 Tax=Paenibacillus solani TaxID=1705565 RepID=UPI0009EC545D